MESSDVRAVAAVAVGGAAGALSRAGVSHAVPHTAWPWATWVTNILGCLAIGVLVVIMVERPGARPDWARPLLITGFLGGFTTFSTYALETTKLIGERPLMALGYSFSSLVLGVTAVWCGRVLTRRLLGLPPAERVTDLTAEEEA